MPVLLDAEPIGYLIIVSNLTGLYQQLILFAIITILITLISAIGAYYFRSVLRRLVSEPIILLRDMATQITLTKDFSSRLTESHVESDEINQLMTNFNDMLQQIEERNHALVLAKNKAEDADRLKSIFLATVSHELRTPLHAILGMTEELLRTDVSEDQRELLSIVSSSGSLLISIINDILDFSKIEAGKLILAPSFVRLQDQLLKIMAMFELSAQKKGIELSISMAPEVPETIMIDSGRLAQVLINLVGNALKFTKSGSVSIVVKRSQSHARKGFLNLAFVVIDTGIGIEENSLKMIFDSFSQIRRSDGQHEGTGLGLAISSRLVVLMGGSIWAESKLGSGSSFHFTVEVPDIESLCVNPVLESERRVAASLKRIGNSPPGNLEGRRPVILLVEDNKVNSMLALRVLTKADYKVLSAVNGQECLDILEKEKVDLILMDLNMPVMDGVEATKKIREQEAITGGHIQIVALTANCEDDQAVACFEAGMDEFLTKPIDRAKLLGSIERLLNQAAGTDSSSTTKTKIEQVKAEEVKVEKHS